MASFFDRSSGQREVPGLQPCQGEEDKNTVGTFTLANSRKKNGLFAAFSEVVL